MGTDDDGFDDKFDSFDDDDEVKQTPVIKASPPVVDMEALPIFSEVSEDFDARLVSSSMETISNDETSTAEITTSTTSSESFWEANEAASLVTTTSKGNEDRTENTTEADEFSNELD